MGETPDLTVAILREIRDEIRGVREEVRDTRETLGARIDQTNARLDQTNVRLDRLIQEQIRHGTAIVSLGAGQRELIAGIGTVVDAVVSIDQRVSSVERGQERIVNELRSINARIDRVLTGPMGEAVRSHDARLDAVETRVDALERRTG